MPNTSRELAVFNFKGTEVRTIRRGKEAWFSLPDVCKILEIGNPRDVARRIPERHKGVDTIDTLGGPQKMRMVSRPGLFRAIFMSRKPEAGEFIDWVTEEVLPAIMDTGQYVAPDHIRKMIGLEMIERAEIENEADRYRWEAEELKEQLTNVMTDRDRWRRGYYSKVCDHPKHEHDGSCTLGMGCSFYR